MKEFVNLINGKILENGYSFEVLSPIDQKIIGEGRLLSIKDVDKVFEQSYVEDRKVLKLSRLEGLGRYIKKIREKFIRQITLETGYTLQDSKDIVDGSIELVTNFSKYIHDTSTALPESKFSYSSQVSRRLKLVSRPYGVVAAMTPQNAPLILELNIILNALSAGNTIILRPSSHCVGTITLLIDALVKTLQPDLLAHISIISCKAVDFLDVSYKRANLIHYIGGSHYGRKILNDSLSHNLKALVDGEGNSTVVIDETANLDQVIKACRDGIIRCNGELCSTIRTIVIADKQYDKFRDCLVGELNSIKVGNPWHHGVDMGPLFNVEQGEVLRNVAKKYSLISGSLASLPKGGNYLAPLLCQLDSEDTGFLNEEVYGPIAGVVRYEGGEWKRWLTSLYRLNDAVFSNDKRFVKEFMGTSHSSRIVINNDPSKESVFEPWGGFLPSGSDEVSFWKYKYLESIQIDTNL